MQISPLESLKRVQLHIWLIGLTNWIKKICYMCDVRTQRINLRVKSGKTKLGREKTAWKWIITLAPHHLPKKWFEGVVLRKDVAAAAASQASLSECHRCNTVFFHHNAVEQPTIVKSKKENPVKVQLNCIKLLCFSSISLSVNATVFLQLKCICKFWLDTPNFLPFFTIQLNCLQQENHAKVNIVQAQLSCIEMLCIWVLRPGGRGGRWATSQQSITSQSGNEDPRNGKVSLCWEQEQQDNNLFPISQRYEKIHDNCWIHIEEKLKETCQLWMIDKGVGWHWRSLQAEGFCFHEESVSETKFSSAASLSSRVTRSSQESDTEKQHKWSRTNSFSFGLTYGIAILFYSFIGPVGGKICSRNGSFGSKRGPQTQK